MRALYITTSHTKGLRAAYFTNLNITILPPPPSSQQNITAERSVRKLLSSQARSLEISLEKTVTQSGWWKCIHTVPFDRQKGRKGII